MNSFIDNSIIGIDRMLRTLVNNAASTQRPSPAEAQPDNTLSAEERQHSLGLMRINHTGEVCAQALYAGQALTAKLDTVRDNMEHAADEEIDHLVWCEQRIKELGGHTSYLNPFFFGASFSIGAAAGLISDKLSLGFVAATEDQVCLHLEKHMKALPEKDIRSKAILQQMHIDEAQHKQQALDAGGYRFPPPVMNLMTLVSKVMTTSTYKV